MWLGVVVLVINGCDGEVGDVDMSGFVVYVGYVDLCFVVLVWGGWLFCVYCDGFLLI